MDTAVRPCRCAHNPSRLKPWTPGSKRPATDSPRLGRFHRRVGLPDAAGAATACLIRLPPAEAAAISAATGQPADQPFETEAR